MIKLENLKPLTPPSPHRGEGKAEGRSFGTGIWNLFGICGL